MSNKDDRYPETIYLAPVTEFGKTNIEWDIEPGAYSDVSGDTVDRDDFATYIRADVAEERIQKIERELAMAEAGGGEPSESDNEAETGADKAGGGLDLGEIDWPKEMEDFNDWHYAKTSPGPFAKLFESRAFGQILVRFAPCSPRGPSIEITINDEDLGICGIAPEWTVTSDCPEEWKKAKDEAKRAFEAIDAAEAEYLANRIWNVP